MPREANFTHMFRTFIPSNGPICLSKCVCCVLFPARFVPVPSLQWAPHSPGVRAKASRYLYRPNSWGPPSQSREMRGQGDGWRIYHGNFRLNQPLEMSLCSLFLFLFFLTLSSFPSFVFLSWVLRCWLGQFVFRSAGRLDKHHSLIPYSISHLPSMFSLSPGLTFVFFLFLHSWCFCPLPPLPSN